MEQRRMRSFSGLLVLLAGQIGLSFGSAVVVFETTSPYHHVQVIDREGLRFLSFDGSMETRMSLRNPLQGHFEYTEHFQMPVLWRPEMKNVLMIGLGGGSTQRAFQHYFPDVTVDTVEIDPTVVQVAKKYFPVKESPTLKIHVSDGRVFLRRSEAKFDVIIMDAYVKSRYGSFIPYHLATKEFFDLASAHLSEDGALAYNVIGKLQGWQADIVGAVYKTMKSVFPEVYFFPSTESQNVVLIGTKSPQKATFDLLQKKANDLINKKRVLLPSFRVRLRSFRPDPPPSAERSPILTDEYAPVDGLLRKAR
jgi:spermidine synthase